MKKTMKIKNNEITFNYYIKNNDIFEKCFTFLYNEKEFNISSKNKDWVKN